MSIEPLDYDRVPPVAGEPRAWCLVLHGLGDSLQGWRPIVPELAIPELGYVLVNAPEPYFTGYSWFPIPGMTDPAHTREDMLAGIRTSRARLAATLDRVLAESATPSERCVLMGFSQGCCMVLDAALRDRRRFAGVVGISGFVGDLEGLPAGLSPVAREQAILWTHGRFDTVVPPERSQHSCAALAEYGVEADYRLYAKDHGLDPAQEIPELRAWICARLDAVTAP